MTAPWDTPLAVRLGPRKRRALARFMLMVTLLGVSGCDSRAESPPNIVLVILDDFASRDLDYLPRLRALTSERGRSFAMVAPTPRCAPSRASLFSGKYAHNTGVQRNSNRPNGGWKALRRIEDQLFACWLSARGYLTHYSGKYINGFGRGGAPTAVPPCWNDWQVMTLPRGDLRYDFTVNANGASERYSGDRYQTDVFAEKTAAFIQGAREPFLAIFAPLAPHSPLVPAKRHAGAMRDTVLQHPPSFNEADVSDKAHKAPPLSTAQTAKIDERTKVRLEMMLSVEDGIAAISQALRDRGIDGRTYLFVLSDNGFLAGEHRIPLGKGLPYRESSEVPLVVIGPGVEAGSRSSKLVSITDIAPTLAELAGAEAPEVDGKSIVPLLSGDDAPWRSRVLLEFFDKDGVSTWAGIRTEKELRVRWPDDSWESYRHTRDPYELAAGRRRDSGLEALQSCAGATCWAEERKRPATERLP